jgi:hypothetical protein
MSNAYDDQSNGNLHNATKFNQIQHAIAGIDGLGFRPKTGVSYTVWKESTTYYCRDNSDGQIQSSGGVATTVVNAAVSQASSDGGGTVHVMNGNYGAVTVTMATNVYLIVDRYAYTFTPSVAVGVNCTVENRSTAVKQWYFNGVLRFELDAVTNGHMKYWNSSGTVQTFLDMATQGLNVLVDYLFWRDGSTYYCRNGSTGEVTTNAAIHTLINSVIASNKVLGFKNGHYDFSNPLAALTPVIKNLAFVGLSGYGKSYHTEGVTFDASDIGSSDSFISINATDDTRSIYGFDCSGIKFIGPSSDASECIHLGNLDTGLIEKCTFLNWGTSIHVYFSDSTTTYTLAEQPGKVMIRDCEFAENYVRDIWLARCTQNNIYGNLFEEYGQRHQSIKLSGTNKTRIWGNEFNKGGNLGDFNEHIMIEGNQGANYIPGSILIYGNWCFRDSNLYPFIRMTETVNPPNDILSFGNIITANFNAFSADSTYAYVDSVEGQLRARDYIQNQMSELDSCFRTMTATWSALNTAYQNLWTPCHVIAKFTIPITEGIKLQQSYSSATLYDVAHITNGNDTNSETRVLSFWAPSLSYFKFVPDGGSVALVAVEACFT